MIEPRIYRAAFLPGIVALVLAMFSLQTEPPPAPIDLAADVIFQGQSVARSAEEIVREHPDRRPGSPGDEAAADLVAGELEERGFEVTDDTFSAEGHDLRNVIGTRVGSERERIVILAGRDASSVPDLAGSATDTAALLELATALEGRAPEKTVVLASVDGSTLGDAGAQRFAETLEDREHVEAVLVLSDLGANSPQGPGLVTWSNDASRVSIGLERTAVGALRAEFEEATGGSGVATQLAQLAFPVGVGAQGVLLDRGIEAIRFSGSGLLPPDPEHDRIDADRVGGVGRAVLQTASAVDSSEGLEHGPASYIRFAGNVVPHWAISMLTLALILPVLVVSVDAFAHARRRREPVGSWLSWLLARIVPFAIGLLVAILFVVATLAPGLSGAAPPPSQEPLDAPAGAILGVVGAAVALAWIFLRPLLTRWGGAQGDPAAPGAACALSLVVSVITVGVWAANPYAALALLP
ncbi:MAG TPA: hypothetical protein VGR10_05915, partial [Thermoleophilaceae bacterium]|nr:hypothetical protein [Thermoleophilaceae bacterium]